MSELRAMIETLRTTADIDRIIRRLRRHLLAGYLMQSFNCIVGAINTAAAIGAILNSQPLVGGLCVIAAFIRTICSPGALC